MKILALDSSARSASVALLEDHLILGENFVNNGLTHSQTLMPMVKSVLDTSRVEMDEIDLFAVSAGPGSFTGVRIGVAAIKGMALAWDKPCIGVSTLRAMAQNLSCTEGIVCAVMDAQRRQVYNALFEVYCGKITRLCEDRALSLEELYRDLSTQEKSVFFVGDGADLCYNNFSLDLGFPVGEKYRLAPAHLKMQRASGVAQAALLLYEEGQAVSADELRPYYLRLPQAERELRQRLGGSLPGERN